MIAFINDHRDVYGVAPICRVLPIAPSTYHERFAQARDIVAGWVDDYNTERPHSSLGYATPAAFAAGLALQRLLRSA